MAGYRCPYCRQSRQTHAPDCGRRRYASDRAPAPIEPAPASAAERAARKAELLRLALACEQGWREANARRENQREKPMFAHGAGA